MADLDDVLELVREQRRAIVRIGHRAHDDTQESSRARCCDETRRRASGAFAGRQLHVDDQIRRLELVRQRACR
jgi:hypothetical protein